MVLEQMSALPDETAEKHAAFPAKSVVTPRNLLAF